MKNVEGENLMQKLGHNETWMSKQVNRILACFILIVLFGNAADAQTKLGVLDPSSDFVKAYEENIGELTNEQLERVKFQSDDTMSICACWELMMRSRAENEKVSGNPLPVHQTAYFIGFVEGRLGMGIPDFWKTALNKISIDDSRFAHLELENTDTAEKQTEFGFACPTSLEVEKTSAGYVVHTKDRHQFLLNESIDKDDAISNVIISGELSFIASYSALGSYVKVYAIKENKPLWKAYAIVGQTSHVIGRWQRSHFARLYIHNEHLVVYGVASHGLYFTAFQIKDGKPVYGFSSTWSFDLDE